MRLGTLADKMSVNMEAAEAQNIESNHLPFPPAQLPLAQDAPLAEEKRMGSFCPVPSFHGSLCPHATCIFAYKVSPTMHSWRKEKVRNTRFYKYNTVFSLF